MQNGNRHPSLIVIGPSASGKSSVVRELVRRRIVRVQPTWTTRPPRPDEHDGALEHRFVGDEPFDELEAAGFFVGTVQLPGLPYRYGLPRPPLAREGPVITIMARAMFLGRLEPFVPHRLVYQIEDRPERARRRILVRGSGAMELRARLDGHAEELEAGRGFADRVFTNDATVPELADAVADALRNDLTATARSLVRP